MSSLQIGLLVIAGIAVAAVYLYNLFEERRVQRRMDSAFQKPEDVLLAPRSTSAPRIEPSIEANLVSETPAGAEEVIVSLSREAAAASTEAAPTAEAMPAVETIDREPTAQAANETHAGAPARFSREAREPDPVIESLAYFSFAEPRDAADLIEASVSPEGAELSWYGRSASEGRWRLLAAGPYGECLEMAAGLLLANRQGAVSRLALRSFLETMGDLAKRVEATLMVPEASAESARADALDKACAAVDVQIGLSLLRRDVAVIAGTRLRGVAESAGFRLNGQGGFDYLLDEDGRLMFQLLDMGGRPLTADSLKTLQFTGVTLLLDVPRIVEPLKAFDQMRLVARRLASTLEASLVDDARQPLADAALAAIRSQLQQACATLRDMQVEPGGARALRLFS